MYSRKDFPRLHPSWKRLRFALFRKPSPTFPSLGAHKCWVTVIQEDAQIMVTVRDDGRALLSMSWNYSRAASAWASAA